MGTGEIKVTTPNSGVAIIYASQSERDQSLLLAAARQELAHDATFLPAWDELTLDEQETSAIEARNYLRAAQRAGLLGRTDVEAPVIHPLIAAIVEQNAKDLAFTTDAVQHSLECRIQRLEAEMWLIRSAISNLIDGDWTPSTIALERALYPDIRTIEARIKHKAADQ